MANDDYVEVTGPDKKTYRFPKGTDKNAAVAYFKKKGIGAPAAPAAKSDTSIAGRVEPYRAAVREGVKEGVKGIVTYPFEAAKLRPGEGEGRKNIGPTGRFLLHSGEDVLGALSAGATAREAAKRSGEGFPGQAIATLEQWPFVNEITKAYEKSGGSFTPDVLRSLTQTETYFVAPKVAADALGVTVDKVRDAAPPALRKYATKLDTRVLRQAESGAKDYKKSAALQVANEGIIGTIRNLPDKIEKVRAQKAQSITQAAAKADAAGTTIDVTPDVQPIITDTLRILNQKGTLNAGTIKEVRSFLNQLSSQVGPDGQPVPRNLRAMKPSDALALTSHDGLLSDTAQFTKSRPDAVNNLARRIRYAMNSRIGQQLPEIMQMRGEESKLITARDAARDNYAQLLNGKYKMINGIIYGDIGYIPLWLALKGSGLGFGAATGGIVMLKALMDNAPSRTARAALAAKLANVLERSKTALQAPSGAAGPSAGGSAITGPNAPTAPVSGPNAALTAMPQQLGAGAAAPPAAPTGGGSPVPQTAGTAAGAALDTSLFQQAKAEMPQGSVSDWAKRAQELKLQHVAGAGQSVAQSNTNIGAAMEPPPGPRWTADRGAIPGEPSYFLDGGPDDAKFAIVEHENKTGTKNAFEVIDARYHSPQSLGYYKTLKEASQAAELESKTIQGHESDVEMTRRRGTSAKPELPLRPKPAPDKLGTPEQEARMRQSMEKRGAKKLDLEAQGKQKAMLDRLDTLYERQANPKSGADRNAIEREITEIKKILGGEDVGTKHAGAPKRIADRERLAAKRAEAAATSGTSKAGASGEGVSSAASPETRAIALDAGYKRLAQFDGGAELVKAMRKYAKDMQKVDPTFDEVQALTDAIETMKEAEGQ